MKRKTPDTAMNYDADQIKIILWSNFGIGNKDGIEKLLREMCDRNINFGKSCNELVSITTSEPLIPDLLLFTNRNNIDILKMLVKNGLNPNIKNSKDKAALDIMLEKGNYEQIYYLLQIDKVSLSINNAQTILVYYAMQKLKKNMNDEIEMVFSKLMSQNSNSQVQEILTSYYDPKDDSKILLLSKIASAHSNDIVAQKFQEIEARYNVFPESTPPNFLEPKFISYAESGITFEKILRVKNMPGSHEVLDLTTDDALIAGTDGQLAESDTMFCLGELKIV